jgi:hypothetical protein
VPSTPEKSSPRECGPLEALAEALDLLDDTSAGKVHDGQQAWQDAYARIHDAAGKPQRSIRRPWEDESDV